MSQRHNDVYSEFYIGHHALAALHLKDTYPVTETSKDNSRCSLELAASTGKQLLIFEKFCNYNGPFLIEMWSENCETVEENQSGYQRSTRFPLPINKESGFDVR